MKNQKKNPGRPKIHGREPKIDVHGSISLETRNMILRSSLSYGDLLEIGARVALGDPNQKRLNEIDRELLEIEPRYHQLKAERAMIEKEIKTIEEERRKKEVQDKYMVSVLKHILELQEKSGRITMDPDYIERAYGSTFDSSRINSNFLDALREFRENVLPSYLIEKYRIVKIGQGEKEKKAMAWIEERREVE